MIEYSLKHISGPATEPVSLAEAKVHLNVHDLTMTEAEEADLASKISAARRDAENVLGLKIGTQTWDVLIDAWPQFRFWRLPILPVLSIAGIYYTAAADGSEAEMPAADYGVSPERGLLWLKAGATWPTEELLPFAGIRIRLNVGMQPVSDGNSPPTLRYPDTIRQAILLRTGTLYSLREDVTLGTTQTSDEVKAFTRLLGLERILIP